jgi:hypothetical protein
MDPSMMGGGGGDIRSAIRDELAAAGLVSQGKPGAGGKAPKADINTIATDVFQLKKMFLHFMRSQVLRAILTPSFFLQRKIRCSRVISQEILKELEWKLTFVTVF